MNLKLFVNIPVKDLDASKAFFKALGFSFNPQFTDDNAACLVLGEDNYFMLLKEDFFRGFTKKPISDIRSSPQAIFSIAMESRAKADEMADKALAAGAMEPAGPSDQGFMYSRSFEDLDGYLWDVFYMDPAHIK